MKKFLFLTTLIAFFGFSQAQQTLVSNDASLSNFERMSKELNLTEAQKAEIMSINKKYTDKKVDIRSSATQEDIESLEKLKQEEINAVLNNDQQEKMRVMQIQQEKDSKGKEFIKSKK